MSRRGVFADRAPWRRSSVVIACACLSLAYLSLTAATSRSDEPRADHEAQPRTRSVVFTYGGAVTGQTPDATVRVWLPVPSSSEDQQVRLARVNLPAAASFGAEPKYGNEILYFEAKADDQGRVPFEVAYRVRRFEVRGDMRGLSVPAEEAKLFLKPDAKVPVDGKPLALLAGQKLPMDQFELGRVLYQIVNDHMTYSKQGTGWGNGDSNWACDSRYGNCSDFHSLFISLARSQNIPAKFEIGFSIPEPRGQGDIPGYHCWGKFRPANRGWIPVDISEANKVKTERPDMVAYYFGNLTENRVTFSVGRDLKLVPPQDGPPLNFLIYPYAEVSGKPVPADKIEKKFSYRDQDGQ